MSEPTRGSFLAMFATTGEAIAFEERCLAIGREFMPAEVRSVLDGGNFTLAYWVWLVGQVNASREDDESDEERAKRIAQHNEETVSA